MQLPILGLIYTPVSNIFDHIKLCYVSQTCLPLCRCSLILISQYVSTLLVQKVLPSSQTIVLYHIILLLCSFRFTPFEFVGTLIPNSFVLLPWNTTVQVLHIICHFDLCPHFDNYTPSSMYFPFSKTTILTSLSNTIFKPTFTPVPILFSTLLAQMFRFSL